MVLISIVLDKGSTLSCGGQVSSLSEPQLPDGFHQVPAVGFGTQSVQMEIVPEVFRQVRYQSEAIQDLINKSF